MNPEARFLMTSRACTRLAALAAMIKLLIFIVGRRMFLISIRRTKERLKQNKKNGSEIQSLGRREWASTKDKHHASLYRPSRIDKARPVQ